MRKQEFMNKKFVCMEQNFVTPCENYSCNNPARYALGNPEAPPYTYMNICDECLKSLRADTGFNTQTLLIIDELDTKDTLMKACRMYGLNPSVKHTKSELINALKEVAAKSQEAYRREWDALDKESNEEEEEVENQEGEDIL